MREMPYLFTCNHCQTQTLVDDQFSGQTGTCISCAQEIRIPQFVLPPSGHQTAPTASTELLLARPGVRRAIAAGIVFVVVACAGVAFVRYGVPALGLMQVKRSQLQAARQIEQIAQALNAYAADHGTYPPPIVRSVDGREMHSWRVLLLPYLGRADLYNQYDLDQPWDADTNRLLQSDMPDVYRTAMASGYVQDYTTDYVLITGPGTLFPPALPDEKLFPFQSLGPRQVTDDPRSTVLVARTAAYPQQLTSWMQPGDLDVVQWTAGNFSTASLTPGGGLDDGTIVATVDGKGHWLSDQTPAATLQALVTIQGGERLPDNVLD